MGDGARAKTSFSRHDRPPPTLGLIVNPVAGLGGAVGLKGTDSVEIVARACARGAKAQASARTVMTLRAVRAHLADRIAVAAAPHEMGAEAARAAGFNSRTTGRIRAGASTPEDTKAIAAAMVEAGVSLILFAGGDGTARDIYDAVGTRVPVVGIPAGVKMHSAVYATNPRSAAALVIGFFEQRLPVREVEVMDIDEAAFRCGAVSAKLYGYLEAPFARHLIQGVKMGQAAGGGAALDAIAADVVEHMEPGCLYILGPGTTVRAISHRLGLAETLLGVDLVKDGRLLAADVTEADILDALIAGGREGVKIVVTPIGGQGHFLGRGNQQISAAVVRQVGRDNIILVATPEKLTSLGAVLLVDTGDPVADEILSGYIRVVTGYAAEAVCRVAG
jgi:predicted polyphosphate/ATP-dependent NAD kinase